MAVSRRDSVQASGVQASTGTHVVAVLVGGETTGYLPNLGDAKGPTTQDRARRLTEANAASLARMHSDYAERAKRPERYEARPFEDLFGGEA